ncbi:hypothetical protein LXL04_034655 [Taraxacum kok-saghyz]
MPLLGEARVRSSPAASLSASEGFVYPGLLVYPVVTSPKTSAYGVEAIQQLRSFENSYIPENPRTPKPLTFLKNQLRGAKNRSNISPVAKKISEKTNFFSKNFAYVQKKIFLHMILYNTHLKGFVKKNLKKNAKKKLHICTKIKKKKLHICKTNCNHYERFGESRSRFFERNNGLGDIGNCGIYWDPHLNIKSLCRVKADHASYNQIKNAGTPEDKEEIEKVRQKFKDNRKKGGFHACGDLLMRMQVFNSSYQKGQITMISIAHNLNANHIMCLGSFENSYIPEKPRTLKLLTFSKNRLRGAKNRSNSSPLHMYKKKKKSCTFAKIKNNSFFRKIFLATVLVFERFLACRNRFFEKVNGLGVLGFSGIYKFSKDPGFSGSRGTVTLRLIRRTHRITSKPGYLVRFNAGVLGSFENSYLPENLRTPPLFDTILYLPNRYYF